MNYLAFSIAIIGIAVVYYIFFEPQFHLLGGGSGGAGSSCNKSSGCGRCSSK